MKYLHVFFSFHIWRSSRNEDDRYHTKIVPVYELYSRTPEYHDEDDRKMLLMAHDWNESVMWVFILTPVCHIFKRLIYFIFLSSLHNPEAHHKARYASFFRLSPYEYVRRENSLYGGKTSYYRKLHWYDFNPYKYFPTNLWNWRTCCTENFILPRLQWYDFNRFKY